MHGRIDAPVGLVRRLIWLLVGLVYALFVLVALAAAAPVAPVAATYYVATTGDNANPGTADQPWRTVQHAANQVVAGDTVLVRGGVYAERVTLTHSGTAGSPIRFQSHPGETAILDGGTLVVPNADNALFMLDSVSYVEVDGFELRNYRSTQANRTAIGIRVQGAGSHIALTNNHIHDITSNGAAGADALGIMILGTEAPTPLSHITIDGNHLHDLTLYWSETLVLNGNVDTFTVTNNLVHDVDNIGIDVVGYENWTGVPDPYNRARNGLIADNVVYNVDTLTNPAYSARAAAGIYVDGGANIVIERNRVYHSNFGIELASEHAGRATENVIVRNNVLHHNHSAGFIMGGFGANRGSTRNCTIINNTLFRNDSDGNDDGEIWLQFNTYDNVIANNIVWAGAGSVLVTNWDTPNEGNIVDHNLYYAPVAAQFANFSWAGDYYEGFANYVAATGNDTHSQYIDPQFAAVGTAAQLDWHLLADSPAIDAGSATYPFGSADYDGDPRPTGAAVDQGADEFAAVPTATTLVRQTPHGGRVNIGLFLLPLLGLLTWRLLPFRRS